MVTDDAELAELARTYRNYGSREKYHHSMVGMNSRLDEIQAGMLRVKLTHIDGLNEERIQLANRYNKGIHNKKIILPAVLPEVKSVWHQYVVRVANRAEVQQKLMDKGIRTMVHYPIPPHLSDAFQYLGYQKGDLPKTEQFAGEVLSLPFYNGLTEEEQNYVIEALNNI